MFFLRPNGQTHLEDLLLQAVDAQRPLGEVQAHAAVADAVHHVQVGLGAAAAHRHRDAEDVDIALGLWGEENRHNVVLHWLQSQRRRLGEKLIHKKQIQKK